jgi:tight adherence protein B
MTIVSTILAGIAILSSGVGVFVFALSGHNSITSWLNATVETESTKYRSWFDELFISWSDKQARRAAAAAKISIVVAAGFTLLLTRSVIFAAALAYVTYWIPTALYRIARDKRLKHFEEHLPDAIGVMVASVRSGNALSTAIEQVSHKIPGPVGQEIGVISREHLVGGLSVEDALARARRRISMENFTMISSAIIINSGQGGDLLHILERMAEAIRALSRLQKKIVTETAEVRAQEKVILVMTPLFGILVCLFDPSIPDILLHRTLGNLLLVTVVVLQVSCVIWIRQIVKSTV